MVVGGHVGERGGDHCVIIDDDGGEKLVGDFAILSVEVDEGDTISSSGKPIEVV